MVDIVTSQSLVSGGLPLQGFRGFATNLTGNGGTRATTAPTEFTYSFGGIQAYGYTVHGEGFGLTYDNEMLAGGTVNTIGIANSGGGFRGTPVATSSTTYYGINATVQQIASNAFWNALLDGDDTVLVDFAKTDGPITIRTGAGDDRVIEGSAQVGFDTRANPQRLPNEIDLGAGDDVLEVSRTTTPLVVTLGAGADTVRQAAGQVPGGVRAVTIADFDPAQDRVEIVGADGNVAANAGIAVIDTPDGAALVQPNIATSTLGPALVVFEGVRAAQLAFKDGVVTGAPATPPVGNPTPIRGTGGDDVLFGTEARDVIDALGGNDAVIALGGDDLVRGRGGDDTIDGGAGNDKLFGDGGNDVIFGAEGDDELLGGFGRDEIYGGAGHDVIDVGPGDDLAYGGAGNDAIFGREGNDRLFGEAGHDAIDGGAGRDELFAGFGNDKLFGGAGNDVLRGEAGNDALFGGDGADILFGGAGADRIVGGKGVDFASYTSSAIGIVLDLLAPATNAGDAAGDVLIQIENLVGSHFDDVIRGGNVANSIFGRGGDDTIDGRAGNDVLRGEGGGDTLLGGAGNDRLFGGAGSDLLEGQSGNDVARGGAGNDRIGGGGGHDVLFGDSGNDSIWGGDGNDVLRGDAGNDGLHGGAGDDQLIGGAGNDYLRGGSGNDLLDGGAGRNVFRFDPGFGRDVVFGFTSGQDRLSLSDPHLSAAAFVASTVETNGGLVFDAGDGNVLTLVGVTFATFDAHADLILA